MQDIHWFELDPEQVLHPVKQVWQLRGSPENVLWPSGHVAIHLPSTAITSEGVMHVLHPF
jgi:hypothetical protein